MPRITEPTQISKAASHGVGFSVATTDQQISKASHVGQTMKKEPNVGIVNYGMGNLTSVRNAIDFLGFSVSVLHTPCEIGKVSHLILPGVGAFGDAMERLTRDGWVDALSAHAIQKQKPFLGICLGMQLLSSRSYEHGQFDGLGWIQGEVTRIDNPAGKIPHMGWNNIRVQSLIGLFATLEGSPDFYFVHSYAFLPREKEVITSWCDYGVPFVASLQRGNIYATQFHPEKSQSNGLTVLRNFCNAQG